MIDFSRINPFQDGRRAAFEELVCQLARHESVPERSVFKRVEGAGGDGGVEAYWTKPDGQKIGYQAKYFLRTSDIDWNQIDASVEQALGTHPELHSYVIALPCDLTDRSGNKRQGQTGWEHWTKRVAKWTEQAAAAGISKIEFVPWTRNELTSHLLKKRSEGLREFFFGDVQLTNQWFAEKLEEAILALDERYHPEDHVDVRLQKLFSIISRDRICQRQLQEKLQAIETIGLPKRHLSRLSQQPEDELTNELQSSLAALLRVNEEINLDPQNQWNQSIWRKFAEHLSKANDRLQQWLWILHRSFESHENKRYEVQRCLNECYKLNDCIDELLSLLRSPHMQAEQQGAAFIRGKAGAGKSHLLARCAENAIANGQPVILLLGQRLNDSDLWAQIAATLGLPGRTADEILGALDSAGKMTCMRALFLVDAINEGPGSRYWRNQISSFVGKLEHFTHICCIISCRSEYSDLAIPEALLKKYSAFEIKGFETPDERLNAARVYLDQRGIARPSTPWLSPEFVNPLFLRSVCLSLQRDQRSEFPLGLTGTKKILRFYLDSVGRNIAVREGMTESLSGKFARAMRGIAAEMLRMKQDFLEIDGCRSTIARHFENIHPKTEQDWLSVFLNNGLLRKDPNPISVDEFSDEDIVRFSFQRFQDFLIAEQSLEGVENVDELFDESGPLGFCIEGDQVTWEWRGLIDALAVVLPERLEVELVDVLPGGAAKWWHCWFIQEAFDESVKWREHSAFTDRSLELLNQSQDPLDTLLQTAVSASHPWNAELLHKNLENRKLPDRDAFWTTWLNEQSDDAGVSVGALIEWCQTGQVPHTNTDNQFLAALVLCWFFSSTNRVIRDKSTKALTNIFLINQGIFPRLMRRFVDIDDLYILERLLAAAFASCCLKPDRTRLSNYSNCVFEYVFREGRPPPAILLRDYAFGIIELSSQKATLLSHVDLDLCRPPYKSPRPRLSVSEEQLDRIAEKAGGTEIVRSATSMGDFASYEIEPRIRRFLRVPLTNKIPFSDEQKARIFEEEVVGQDRERIEAFDNLQRTTNPYTYGLISPLSADEPSEEEILKWKECVEEVQTKFLKLLNGDEVRRFSSDVIPHFIDRNYDRPEHKKFNFNSIKRWVAKRAYAYGWTRKRFQGDQVRMERYSRDRPNVERIGKKYQWLALDEISSRLADNYWLEGEYGEIPKVYASPLDLGFERDIDPTILAAKENHALVSDEDNRWAFEPWIILDRAEEARLASWPFEQDPSNKLKSLPHRTDRNGTKWLVLYEHQSVTDKYEGDRVGEHGMRSQEFRIFATVMVKAADAQEIGATIKSKAEIDMHWAMSDVTDTSFLFEAAWRDTWSREQWLFDRWTLPPGAGYAQMTMNYQWESHLDAALPNGYSSHLPSPWLIQKLQLTPDLEEAGVWRTKCGEIVFREFKAEEGGGVCLFRMDKADELAADECTFLSVLISERNVWPGGHNSNAAWRRAEGVCWKEGRGIKVHTWKRDTGNCSAKKV